MISAEYLERAAEDLKNRIGSLVINNQTVPILNVTRKGRTVIVETLSQQGLTEVKSIRLFDEQGHLITEKETRITVADQQRLAFRFEFDVKGGESA